MPYEENPETLGEHLFKRRYELGLLQKDVAKIIGVTTATYFIWENDRHTPLISYMGKVIKFLGYDPFPEPQTIGERITAKRRVLGLTRKKLAQHLGVDEGTLWKWESGRRMPMGKYMEIAERFLRCGWQT